MNWDGDITKNDPQAEVGLRIRMLHMDDQYGVDEGMEGTISKIDDLGTIHVNWDDGSQLGVIPQLDKYVLLPASKDQVKLDFFMESDFKLSSASKQNKMGKKTSNNFKKALSKTNVSGIKIESEEIISNKITIKDEVKRILNSIKTSKPIHRSSLDNMVKNLINKYKTVKKDEKKFTELIEKLKDRISDKFDLDETTMSGSAGAYVGPMTKKIEEITSTQNTDYTSGVDDKFWADKNGDGWYWNDKSNWEGGEIVDLLAKVPATWDDSNLDISKEWDKTTKGYISEIKDKTIHTKKWDRCVDEVEKKNKENKTNYNPYAVCQKSIGYEGSIKKQHRKKDIEEATTFSSVFGGGFPVTPFMFAKKGKHVPSKKTLWPGGKIVQKIDNSDIMGESILDEINKVKWVKGGKYVKITDRCAKYNNKPWCSQGALDNPLELSDNTFENIEIVSKKSGLSEEQIYNKIVGYFNK